MIWQGIKKQGLTFLRNRQHLFMLIGLPLILISILSLALGGFIRGEAPVIKTKVALTHYDEEGDIERFLQELESLSLNDMELNKFTFLAKELSVMSLLTEKVFPSFQEEILLDIIEKNEVDAKRRDKNYSAIIEVPENFTYQLLQFALFKQGELPSLGVYVNEEKEISAKLISHILGQIEEQLSFLSYAAIEGVDVRELLAEDIEVSPSYREISQYSKTVAAKDYYTFAMAVMNVLFIASAVGSYAYREKKDQIFNRILIADISRFKYFFGIYLSAVIFAFLQLMIIFLAAKLIFSFSIHNLVGLLLVSFALSLAVGGVASLLSAISYRMNSETLTNYFQSVIVFIFAFLGGSYFPTGSFPDWFLSLGNLTPNGAGLSAYLLIFRYPYAFSTAVMEHVYYLGGFSVVLLVISIFIFPKRGENL